MGTINHNAIIATTWDPKIFDALLTWVNKRAQFIKNSSMMNGYQTLVLVPDGSKEGWANSSQGDVLRNEFIDRLEQDKYGDESSPWCWIEVGYGEYGQKVLRGNNKNCFGNNDYAE